MGQTVPGCVNSAQVVIPQAHIVHFVPHVHGGFVKFLANVLEDGIYPRVRIVDTDVQPAVLLPLDALEEALDLLILLGAEVFYKSLSRINH